MLTKRIFSPATRKFGALDYLISTSIFALALTLIFLFSCATLGVIAFKLPNPLKFTSALAYIALYLSAFSSSFIISKKNGQKYLLCALFNASFLFFALFILAILGKTSIFSLVFALRLASLLFIFLGAFLGIRRQKVKKHKKRKFNV